MVRKEDEFLKRLLQTFKIEAEEHLRVMSSALLELEKAPASEKQIGIVETVFREAHSLKGAARAVNLVEIETICQSLESVFSALKRQALTPSPALFDTLHKALDALGDLTRTLEAGRAAPEKSRVLEIASALESALKGAPSPSKEKESKRVPEGPVPAPQPVEAPPSQLPSGSRTVGGQGPVLAETVRISTSKLNSLLLEAEDLLSVRLALGERRAELREVAGALASWEKERAKIQSELRNMRASVERRKKGNGETAQPDPREKVNQRIEPVLEFLEWNDGVIRSLESRLEGLTSLVGQDHRALSSIADGLLEDMKRALMLPFSSLLEVFPKFVRDLSREHGKDVRLLIHDGGIEADRRILEEMRDPLVHLLRNCIDHGIELPNARAQKGKPPQGTINISLSRKNGDKMEILISDDGAGINFAKVRAAALKLGVVPDAEAKTMTEARLLSLVFESGVSTLPVVTSTSGRGLGLAIVREKVEKLGGSVTLETRPDRGTTFRIILPVTLASFRGLLVRVDEQLFVAPLTHVQRAVRLSKEEIKTVENRETIRLNGEVLSLARLGDILELPRKSARSDGGDKTHVVVLTAGEKRVAFQVDEILHEQEVIVKGLGKQLARVRNVAGAAVLGTGQVAPVLNVLDLMKSVVKTGAVPAAPPAEAEEPQPKGRSILVVEDSITARTLLKNILESAGYRVETAVDGVDAFTKLRTEEFDSVVSDVDMPRMNGFELTAKIRADKKLSGLPVVLVTALESREDRERGVDVGASAYIVKSSFDQSNLLEVIRRLI